MFKIPNLITQQKVHIALKLFLNATYKPIRTYCILLPMLVIPYTYYCDIVFWSVINSTEYLRRKNSEWLCHHTKLRERDRKTLLTLLRLPQFSYKWKALQLHFIL
jgi:hypothetical protein